MDDPKASNDHGDTGPKPSDIPLGTTGKHEGAELPNPKDNAPTGNDNPSKQSAWKRWQEHSLSDRIMAYFTGVVAICAVLQIFILMGGSDQTNQLIKAAQMSAHSSAHNAAAAQSFAESATSINTAIDSAVTQLAAQASQMDKARAASDKQSTKALQAAIDNFHQEQRAWVYLEPVRGVPKSDANYEIVFPIANSGRTPARNVHMYFSGTYIYPGQVMTYPFKTGTEQPIAPITPGPATSHFTYNGKPDTDRARAKLGNASFVVWGAITYDDVFRNSHWITYCFFEGEQDTYASCKGHNDLGDGLLPSNALAFY